VSESEQLAVTCSKPDEIVGAINKVVRTLTPELRKPFREILMNYVSCYTNQEIFDRMNNRTVAQIIAEYRPGIAKEIASGEVDGVRYHLYGPLPAPPADDEQKG
jgi:hypothetical protein